LEILRYFGQQDADVCDNCDNCQGGRGGRRGNAVTEVPEGSVLEAVRIVLSGVARAHGRFGKQVIAQMLCGATTAKVTKFRLDRLSTYGLLSYLKQQEVMLLVDALITAGCLEQTDVERFRPIVQLTELGNSVMRGQATLSGGLTLPVALFRKLGGSGRVTKKQKPAARREVREPPAEATVVEEPNDSGPSHGEPAAAESPVAAVPTNQQAYNDAAAQPAHYWTWRLLASGYTPAECAVIRSLDPGIVLDHALRALDTGLKVEASWFLTADVLRRMEEVIGQADPLRIRPLLAQLPRGTRYEEVLLYLKCRKAAGSQ
jgi:ATP-dependent DNA helicase RecQ